MERFTLPYQIDAVTQFERLRQLPLPVLLHSAAMGGGDARYDIMAADPERTIQYDGATLCVGTQCIATRRPFDVLRRLLPVHPDAPAEHFRTGFIGYFAYALQHVVEALPRGGSDPTEMPMLWGGDYPWSVVTDHLLRTTTLWCRSTLGTSQRARIRALLTGAATREDAAFAIGTTFATTFEEDAYRDAFAQVRRYIDAGDCYQVNLARHFRTGVSGDCNAASWEIFRRLLQRQPGQFSAHLTTPHGVVVAMSPERFIRFSRRCIETAPIKGTMPRHADPDCDRAARKALTASIKDRAENVMIVDLMRNDLGRLCIPGSIQTRLFDVDSYANVHHLVSRVYGVPSSDTDAWRVLGAVFPGGSVTGAPKIRAMQIINALEPVGRSVYCGCIGYIDDGGTMDTNIAIRTLVVTPDAVHCWGGGGIVADSRVELELAEIDHKIGMLLQTAAGLSSSSACRPA